MKASREEKTREHFKKFIQLLNYIAENIDKYSNHLEKIRVKKRTLYLIDTLEFVELSLIQEAKICIGEDGEIYTVVGKSIKQASEKDLETLYIPKGKEFIKPRVKKLRKLIAKVEEREEAPIQNLL